MNVEAINNLNVFLGVGAILLQVLSVSALILLFFGPKKNKYLAFIDKHFITLGFFVSLAATLFSLVYSEVIKFPPCYLCWWARVFMYPVVLIFGTALWAKRRGREDKNSERHFVVRYSMPLAFFGLLLAVYHNFNYYFADTGNMPCDASGVSCYQKLVHAFGGYISIPMLSLSSILAIVTILTVAHFYGKRD